jgi:hypothetical protein
MSLWLAEGSASKVEVVTFRRIVPQAITSRVPGRRYELDRLCVQQASERPAITSNDRAPIGRGRCRWADSITM